MYDKPISYSGMKLFNQCPRRWEDQYIDGNRYPSGKAAQRGTDIHAQLEAYFNELAYPEGDQFFERWRTYMMGLAAKKPKAEVEFAVNADWQPVEWGDPTAFFRGKVDLVIPCDDDTYVITDWKTGKFYIEHGGQATAYVALAPDADRYQTNFVYLDDYPSIISMSHSTEERAMYREDITQNVNRIREATEYPAKVGSGCKWCSLNWRNGGRCNAAP